MTLGIYHGGRAPQNRVNYNPQTLPFLRWRTGPGGFDETDIQIDIAKWYSDFGGYPGGSAGVSSFQDMMCDDISTLMWTALETQGIASDTMFVYVPDRSIGGSVGLGQIISQPLKGAGPNQPYIQSEFVYHSPLIVSGTNVGTYFDSSNAYAYDSTGNPWLECDYVGWAMPYYFHNGLQVPNGGLAWNESWTIGSLKHYASNPSVGWVPPVVRAINPNGHNH